MALRQNTLILISAYLQWALSNTSWCCICTSTTALLQKPDSGAAFCLYSGAEMQFLM